MAAELTVLAEGYADDRVASTIALVREGDTVIVTAGSPPGVPGNTNMVQVHHLGQRARL